MRPAEAADLKYDALLVCVSVYILASVGRVHELFPVVGMFRPTVVAGLLGITIYLFDEYDERRLDHLFVPTTKLLVAFLAWMILSVPGALVNGISFDLVFGNFIKTVVMYFVVAGSVRRIQDVERLAVAYLAAAVVYSGVVITRFDLGTGAAWRLGRLYYYDANDFATFAVTAMPLGLYFLLDSARRPAARWLAAFSVAVLTLGFVRSGSRGGFLALLAVGVFIVLRYKEIPLRWRLSATTLVAVLFLGAASDQYWAQMGTVLSDSDYNRTEETGRIQIWQRGVGYMLENPLLGVGPNNFGAAEGMLSPFAQRQQFGIGVPWNAPHNSFVQVGAELGIPGLALFLLIIGSAFAALRKARRGETMLAEAEHCRAHLTPALTASLLGFVVGSFFLTLAYSEMLFTLVALAVGLQKVVDRGLSI